MVAEKEIYIVDGKNYTVITKTKENANSDEIYLTETECKFNEVASKLLGEEVKAKQVKEELEFLN